jgi:hypothetical protein
MLSTTQTSIIRATRQPAHRASVERVCFVVLRRRGATSTQTIVQTGEAARVIQFAVKGAV